MSKPKELRAFQYEFDCPEYSWERYIVMAVSRKQADKILRKEFQDMQNGLRKRKYKVTEHDKPGVVHWDVH